MAHNSLTDSNQSTSTATPGRRLPSRVRLVGFAAGILLSIGLFFLGAWIMSSANNNTSPATTLAPEVATAEAPLVLNRPAVTQDGLIEKSGIKLVYVAVTGGGGLIDLRYLVYDPVKANAIHDDDNPPTIIDEETGLVVNQLLMGHSHSGNFNAGQTYYLIFENPGNLIQRGSTVSILLGNAEVEHVKVQ